MCVNLGNKVELTHITPAFGSLNGNLLETLLGIIQTLIVIKVVSDFRINYFLNYIVGIISVSVRLSREIWAKPGMKASLFNNKLGNKLYYNPHNSFTVHFY